MPRSSELEGPHPLASRVADIECVLFDLDGTLIDTIDMIRASMRYATDAVLGEALPDEILMCNVGIPLRQQMTQFSEEHADELLKVYREHNGRVHDEMIREYPGVDSVLAELSARGLRLGIVTSKSRSVALRGLERFGLERFFETVVTCDDVDRFKPDPYPLQHAAATMGVDIKRCAYVGDSPHDMTAAVAAGCVSIAALWGAFSADVVLEPGPSHQATSMSDVLAIMSGHEDRHRVT